MRRNLFIRVLALIASLMVIFSCTAFAVEGDDKAKEVDSAGDFESSFNSYAAQNAYSQNDDVLTEDFVQNCVDYNSTLWTSNSQKKLINIVKKYGDKNREAIDGNGDMTITVDGVDYVLDQKGVSKAKAQIISAASDSKVKGAVVDIGSNFNVEADIEGAATALSGIEGIISTIVGILVYAVTIGMTLFTACDICYITMPVFRNKCDDIKASGGVGTKTDSSGNAVLMFVTDDAQHAVQVCTVETGKNPLALYAKKRVVAFILLGLVIFILLTGNIGLLVNIAVNIAAGIIDVLSGLGG